MKTKIAVGVVIALVLGIGGFVKWDMDRRALGHARSEAKSPEYGLDGRRDDTVLMQNFIRQIEKAEKELSGVWLVSSGERSELNSKLSARKATLEDLLAREIERRRKGLDG